jgi:hypothetical protein
MSLRTFLLMWVTMAFSGNASAATPQPGEQKFFKNWAAACDNTLSCEAVALEPESYPNDGLSLVVARDSADGKVTVRLYGTETTSDRYRIFIDGRFVDSGILNSKSPSGIEVTGTDAIKLTRAIAGGLALSLDDGKGGVLGKASLAGSAAALRHIDATQNRAGTPAALAAPGKRKFLPKSLHKPVLTIKRIIPNDITPDATTIVSLIESSGCAENRYGVTEDAAHSLGRADGTARALVLVNCGTGAYQSSFAPYIGKQDTDGQWAFEPAQFDFGHKQVDDKGVYFLIGADWDAAKQILSAYSKSRGLGDCGVSESYVWDGTIFRLVEAFGMARCRGSLDWMTLWRAEAKLVE